MVSAVEVVHASQDQAVSADTAPPPNASGAVRKEKISEAPVSFPAFTASSCAQ